IIVRFGGVFGCGGRNKAVPHCRIATDLCLCQRTGIAASRRSPTNTLVSYTSFTRSAGSSDRLLIRVCVVLCAVMTLCSQSPVNALLHSSHSASNVMTLQ